MKHLLILLFASIIFASCKSGSSTKGWPASDVKDFISSCEREAIGGGLEKKKAEDYCSCMQVKMEKLYPSVQDASKVSSEDLQTPSMQASIKECLGQ